MRPAEKLPSYASLLRRVASAPYDARCPAYSLLHHGVASYLCTQALAEGISDYYGLKSARDVEQAVGGALLLEAVFFGPGRHRKWRGHFRDVRSLNVAECMARVVMRVAMLQAVNSELRGFAAPPLLEPFFAKHPPHRFVQDVLMTVPKALGAKARQALLLMRKETA